MTAIDVANQILYLAARDGVPVSPMKLNKLAYFCHGWHLAITRRPLLDESVEAWDYGPVVPSLYRAYKRFGRSAIADRGGRTGDLSPQSRRVIDGVWRKYKDFTAIKLSEMTHRAGTPWAETKREFGSYYKNLVIPDDLILAHFRELATGARHAGQ